MVQHRSRRPGARSAVSLALLAAATVAADAADPPVPPFAPPPVHYSKQHSFRGVGDGGKVTNFHISGHASGLPGVHDYLRLVPPNPLAYGGIFTQVPLDAEEWVAEIAFRVHGPPAIGLVEPSEDGHVKKAPKGGRGLAFWYTKTDNPTGVTISPDPKAALASPPPFTPQPGDATDPKVSLFGFNNGFDGLGIIFDTSPTSPLHARSDKRNWEEGVLGVAAAGVVSGIMDDGKGDWMEPKKRVFKDDDEAAYLEKAVGECEAAFRNAQGLLWARISYIKQTIRVDLDLSPHTTLAKAGRDYAHNCFILDGIKLSPGNYLGLTGLAAGNAEPDAVDVYAMDVFEVVKIPEGGKAPATDEPKEPSRSAEPLEGTSDDASDSLAHEIFLSQAKMVEAIDALSRRVELLTRSLRGTPGREGSVGAATNNPLIISRLSSIETSIAELAGLAPRSAGGDEKSEADTLKHLLQLQDRLMIELQSFGRKLDTANGQNTATLATLSSRSSESLALLQAATAALEKQAAKGNGWVNYVLSMIIVFGVATSWGRGRREGGWGSRKMI
ncbi:Legume-like lectin [Pseudohyphozyma bogoriensis]|nr:Legume-like lectin [Pseudohyphozyma bogoriensis]